MNHGDVALRNVVMGMVGMGWVGVGDLRALFQPLWLYAFSVFFTLEGNRLPSNRAGRILAALHPLQEMDSLKNCRNEPEWYFEASQGCWQCHVDSAYIQAQISSSLWTKQVAPKQEHACFWVALLSSDVQTSLLSWVILFPHLLVPGCALATLHETKLTHGHILLEAIELCLLFSCLAEHQQTMCMLTRISSLAGCWSSSAQPDDSIHCVLAGKAHLPLCAEWVGDVMQRKVALTCVFRTAWCMQLCGTLGGDYGFLALKLLYTMALKFVFRSSCLFSRSSAYAHASVWMECWWKLHAFLSQL